MKPLLDDALWAVVEPLLPKERRPGKKGGRPRVSNRQVFTGILFVLRTGLPWQLLPLEMGCGSGSTCWRRFRTWTQRGIWRRLHAVLLQELAWADEIDWNRVAIDSSTVAAKRGATSPARIQRTKAARAASAILWSTPKGYRSRSA
jgi:transposase